MPRRPVDEPRNVTTYFGVPDQYALYKLHSGYDYGKGVGSNVRAPANGTIVATVDHSTRGYMVVLFDGLYYHRLMHNSVFKCRPGDQVSEGNVVALSGGAKGAPGAGLSTGPHVHWDMNKRGVDTNTFADFVDPDLWLKGQLPTAAPAPPPVVVAPQPYQRMVRPTSSVYYRSAPNTTGLILQEFAAGDPEPINFKGWVYGESVGGNNIWFKGRFTDGYSWSGAFTDTSTNGLEDLNPKPVTPPPGTVIPPTPVPTPPVVTPPTPPAYTFTKDVECVTEVIPAATTNFQYGNFPDKPAKIVMHDFGTKNVNTLQSVINHFTNVNVEVSAHFIVSEKRIIQMVSLKDRAWHAGPNGNDFIGIEIDPTMSQNTIVSTRVLLQQLEHKYGYRFELIEHNQIMNTLCGDDINLADFDIHGPTPTPTPPSDKTHEYVVNFLSKTFKDF